MSERIRELIKTKSTILFPGTDTVDCEITDIEKFAQLIIQECAEIAQREQAFNARYSDADQHPQVNVDQCILMSFGL